MNEDKTESSPEITRGSLCVNPKGVLFIVCMPAPQEMTWNGQPAGLTWVGVQMLTGEYILCDVASTKLIAKDFRTYIQHVAVKVGVKHARRVLKEKEAQ